MEKPKQPKDATESLKARSQHSDWPTTEQCDIDLTDPVEREILAELWGWDLDEDEDIGFPLDPH